MNVNIALFALTVAAPLSAQTVVATSAPPIAPPPVAASPIAASPVSVSLGAASPGAASPGAAVIAAKLFPDGTYRKILGETFSKMMSGMIDQLGDVPLDDFMKAYGVDATAAPKLDKPTMNKIAAIVDPAFKDRTRLMMNATLRGMIPLFETMEPELRAGLAESLARRFTPAELRELTTFFDTPTGSSFASQQMLLFMDPAVMGRMQTQIPKMTQALPALAGDAIKATAGLPKAKKYADLTPAERRELATLLGIGPKKAKR